MTTITITKTGVIEFEEAIGVSGVSLNLITLYLKYNITEEAVYQPKHTGDSVTIPKGYYTYEQLQKLMPYDFSYNENTLKIEIEGEITGGLTKLVKDGFPYLTPLCLYMYIEGIDTSRNVFNGQRSELLSIIPIGKANVGDLITYKPATNYKKMYKNTYTRLKVHIQDEHGVEYDGKFVAEITLHK